MFSEIQVKSTTIGALATTVTHWATILIEGMVIVGLHIRFAFFHCCGDVNLRYGNFRCGHHSRLGGKVRCLLKKFDQLFLFCGY